uniref:Uncharacterized LOC113475032 n=1 Tax=Ciona intestinalis TaxID=7719 RepID=F6R8N1_CIOIN|nr:uncharacterized protein LOC113475032 [Ciona intestinalis]|eukprot:XP_026694233.1 uncharacterized protein LOC113475032 [Ciona intestinalis]
MRWTKGLIDYHGVDSFDNIKAKIDMVTWPNLVQPVCGADISDDDDVTSSDDAISLNEVIGSDDVASVNELAKVNDVIMVPEVTKFTDVTVSNFIDVTTTNA